MTKTDRAYFETDHPCFITSGAVQALELAQITPEPRPSVP